MPKPRKKISKTSMLDERRWRGEARKPKPNACPKCGGKTEIVGKGKLKARACVKRCGSVVRTVGK